jgi:imidazolonepropionase-like amidohydrolase
MRIKVCLIALILIAINCSAFAQGAKGNAAAPKGQAVAFVGVNVIPMDRERVLENQTVVVRDGRITEVGSATKIKVPADALRVDGRGKYLMPGLAEMHGHLPHPNMSEQVANSILFLFVANGVTTVRGMFGFDNHTRLRERVAKGELLGPRIYAASPALSGQSVGSPQTADQLVRKYKQDGFDLLKVHEGLSLEAYNQIVTTAGQVGIPFGGHVADKVGLLHSLKSKQSTVEHLDGYLEALEADDSPIRDADPQTRAQKLPFHLDERKIPALVEATREAGAWNVPTMALWQTFIGDESAESLSQRQELKYIPPQMIKQWVTQRTNQLKNPNDPAAGARILEIRNRVLKALQDGGAKIMLGSDAPQLFSVPGFSLHREMQAMIKAGLTPYQVLESGTRNPAIYLKATDDFGMVEAGRRADLILLNDNPLKDLAAISNRAGVMVAGRWIAESEIRKRLDEIAAMHAEKN